MSHTTLEEVKLKPRAVSFPDPRIPLFRDHETNFELIRKNSSRNNYSDYMMAYTQPKGDLNDSQFSPPILSTYQWNKWPMSTDTEDSFGSKSMISNISEAEKEINELKSQINHINQEIHTKLQRVCDCILKNDPSNSLFCDLKASLSRAEGNYAQALVYFKEEIHKSMDSCINTEDLYPQKLRAHYGLAHCHYQLGNIPDAIKAYEKTIELDPNFLEAHYGLGCCHYLQKNIREAEDHLNKAFDLNNQHGNTIYMLARIHSSIGDGFLVKADFKAAIENYTKAISIDEENILSYCKRGLAYSGWGQPKKASEDFQNAIDLIKENNYDARDSDQEKEFIKKTLYEHQNDPKLSSRLRRLHQRVTSFFRAIY